MIEALKALSHSRKFWLAMLALLQTILFQFFPQFPPSTWQAIDAVLMLLIAAIAHEDAADKRYDIIHAAPADDPAAGRGIVRRPDGIPVDEHGGLG